jgi:hypothetical protein
MSWNKTDPPITIEQMLERDKLVTLDQGREILATTEPLTFADFSAPGDNIRFRLDNDWNAEAARLHGTDPVEAFVSVNDGQHGDIQEYQLTLDALHQATTTFGMGKGYVDRAPGHLTEDALNWWFRTGLRDKNLKLMLMGGDQRVSAITRETVTPFSNLELLDKMLEVIETRHPGVPVYVDRNKLTHSLRLTHLQLVLPEIGRIMEGTGEVDDRWWGGVQLTNSMTAEAQSELSAFVFRQRCTNGYIDTLGDAGRWSRKQGGQEMESVLQWAEDSVNQALSSFEGVFDRVQSLVEMTIDPGSVEVTAQDLFEQYRLPVAARQRIISNLVETNQLTMYALTNAVTAAANGDVPAAEQQRLMRTGGEVIRHADRCGGCHRILPDGSDSHSH